MQQGNTVCEAFNKTRLNANGTTVIKSNGGVLHSVSINTKGATANTVTLYNNTAGSGDVIGVIDTTSQVTTLFFDVIFTIGLTVVVAAGTAADITIAWR